MPFCSILVSEMWQPHIMNVIVQWEEADVGAEKQSQPCLAHATGRYDR